MVEKFDYIESQADADELIAEFGQTGAIPRTTMGPPPNEWTPGEEVTVYHQVNLAVLPIELKNAGLDIDGTLIKASDKQILMSVVGLAIEPTTTDIVLVNGTFVGDEYQGGEAYTILRCITLAPAGVPVVHDLLART
jgi:hypothetical protein